ncbi:hypothetical protein [Zunongwangia sp. H14]|uniref:hypothetical protein n=1 Tax=Zunongwangia sp. H14 TaxID=3240792 RepID=UPI003564C7F9
MFCRLTLPIFSGILYFSALLFSGPNTGNKNIGKVNCSDPNRYEIVHKWKLPDELDEVSGIAWLEDDKIACIQDEKGNIYIYNPATSQIEKEIKFAGHGDYEGISVKGNTAYVVRSDGRVYEVTNFLKKTPEVHIIESGLTRKQNIESICVEAGRRLLLGTKYEEENTDQYKGIYAYNLTKKHLIKDPVIKIKMRDKIFEAFEDKDPEKVMSPSDIAIHPDSGEIYIVDGRRPKLLILSPSGMPEKLIELDKDDFAQPEGICFSPSGNLYISNEASGGTANILEVKILENISRQQ